MTTKINPLGTHVDVVEVADDQGNVDKVSEENPLGALQEMNDGLQHEVQALVTRKSLESVTDQQVGKSEYPVHHRLDEIKRILGDVGELKVNKVPDGHKGDFSIIVNGLKEPREGETRQSAMQRYIAVELPRVKALLESSLPEMEFSIAGMYLNVSFKKSPFVADVLNTTARLGDKFGNSDVNRGRRVVIDYSSPNTAKTMHVGHLRSTVIGEILKRVMEATGATAYGINHIGDWGTQFGQLVVACELWGDEVKASIDPDKEPVRYLSELYKKIKGAIKDEESKGNSELADRSRSRFSSLEKGDPEIVKLWQEFRRLSLIEFERMYQRLGIGGLDLVLGESFYEDKMEGPSQDAVRLGIVEKDEAGALVLKFNTKLSLERAMAAGMVVHCDEVGGLILNPRSVNFSGLENLNKGNLSHGLEISLSWKVPPQMLEGDGGHKSEGSGLVNLRAIGNISLAEALKHNLVSVVLSGERQMGGDKRKFITMDIARSAGLIAQGEDSADELILTDLPSCIFKTTDGRSVYITRDAAALRHRMQHFNATDILYVVGNEQSLHLSQLFEMARRIGDISGGEPQHVAFGMMKSKGGSKISSREGAGGLSDFLDELTDAAEVNVKKREILAEELTTAEIRQTAEKIAIGALIFSNIIQDISRDLEFDREAMMKFEGQTGPYIQYTSVRINSLLNKHPFDEDSSSDLTEIEVGEAEYRISKTIAEFVDVVELTANRKSPHILAEYLLKLCGEFNNLYTGGAKLRDLDDNQKRYYLALYKSVYQVLKNGMRLLNIPMPEKM